MNHKTQELSKQLAEACGLKPLRPPSPQGTITNNKGEVYQWWKCPRHNTWLQPAWEPYVHWKCLAEGCDFKRPAKMRTSIERSIFYRAKLVEYDN